MNDCEENTKQIKWIATCVCIVLVAGAAAAARGCEVEAQREQAFAEQGLSKLGYGTWVYLPSP